MEAFWPGPLTLVLNARPEVPGIITAGQTTVAIRQPDHPVCLELLHRFGSALVAPSANRYMALSPTTPEHVARQFADTDLLILDGGPCRVGLESSIVSLLPGEPPRLLRPGMVGREDIARVLGCAVLHAGDSRVRVPGQHERHCAPATPAWRFETANAQWRDNPRIGWLLCGRPLRVAGMTLDLGDEPDAYARGLYAALYQLDHAGLDGICVQLPQDEEDWRAIRDRLYRATRPAAAPDAPEAANGA